MKKFKMASQIMILALLLSVVWAQPVRADADGAETGKVYHTQITGKLLRSEVPRFVELLNEERARQGYDPVKLDATAMKLAERRAAQMTFLHGHSDPMNEESYTDTITEVDGISISEYEWGGENAAFHPYWIDMEEDYAGDIFKQWMNSEGHRYTLLQGTRNDRIGIAFFTQYGLTKDGTLTYTVTAAYDSLVYSEKYYPWVPYEDGYEDAVRTFQIDVMDRRLDVEDQYFPSNKSYPKTLQIGETEQLYAQYRTEDSGTYITSSYSYLDSACGRWVSSDPAVVMVDDDGMIRAIGKGKATVSFLVNGDPGKAYNEYVVVKNPDEIELQQVYGIKWSKASDNTLKLSWSAVDNAAGYQVYRSTKKDSGYTKVASTKGTKLTITAAPGKTYYYKVRAYYNKQYGSFSTAKKIAIPITKAKITSTVAGTKKLTVAWKKVKGVSGYQIYAYQKNSKGTFDKHRVLVKSSSLKGSVKGLKSGKTYYVRVRAYRTVNGKKVYGEYSTRKMVRVK